MARIAWYAAIVLITLTLLFLLWQFSLAIFIFLLSLVVSAAFGPLIQNLVERGLPRWMAMAAPYLLVLLILVAILLAATGPLVEDLQQATGDLIGAYDRTKLAWLNAESSLLNNLAAQLPSTQDLFNALTGENSDLAIRTVFGAAEGLFNFVGRLAIVLALSIYWSAGQVRFERLGLSLLPVEWRWRARRIWKEIQLGVGRFLRREFTLSLLAGILLGVGYPLLGVPYPTLLAFTAALLRLIPWLGAVMLVIVPLLAGFTTSVWAGAGAALYSLAVFLFLEAYLSPRIFSRQRYSSLLLVLVVIALVETFGLLGAIFGPPLAVTVQILFENLLLRQVSESNGSRTVEAADLQEKMNAIRQEVVRLEGPQAAETASLAGRLEQLVEKTLALEQNGSEDNPLPRS